MTNNVKIYSALIKARAEIENPIKDKPGHKYKYADLAQIINISVPLLAKYDLAIIQPVSFEEGRIVIETRIIHGESGEHISEKCSWPKMAGNGMNEMQAMGSVITYGRRYALAAMLNVAQEDDDAASLEDIKSPPAAKIVNAKQAQEIKQLLMQTQIETKKVLEFAGCSSIDEMPAYKYPEVKAKLLSKIKEAKEGQACE